MERLLEVQNLSVDYNTYAGTVHAVRDISFGINVGETVAIVGESGCGKSVTAKSIMGLVQQPPGHIGKESRIIYQNRNILDQSEKEWSNYRGNECSMIFQDALAALNPTRKIGKQIVESLENHRSMSKEEMEKEAIHMLDMVGIPDAEKSMKRYPHELSGGMRQRVMIAMALICNPKILIADEPTTALDVTIQAQIIDLMINLQKEFNTAIILITHDLGVVAQIAHRIIVMYAGQIVEEGTSYDIFYNPKHPYTKALLNSVPRLDLQNKQELAIIEGTVANLISPPKGCSFSPRCDSCMNICLAEEPLRTCFNADHYVSCWKYFKDMKTTWNRGGKYE